MPDLFISYARGDSRDFVARLSAALEDRGKETWVDRGCRDTRADRPPRADQPGVVRAGR